MVSWSIGSIDQEEPKPPRIFSPKKKTKIHNSGKKLDNLKRTWALKFLPNLYSNSAMRLQSLRGRWESLKVNLWPITGYSDRTLRNYNTRLFNDIIWKYKHKLTLEHDTKIHNIQAKSWNIKYSHIITNGNYSTNAM